MANDKTVKIINKIRFRGLERIKTNYTTEKGKLTFLLNGIVFGDGLVIRGNVYIKNYGSITLGKNVTINSADWANPIGSGSKMFFQVFDGGDLIVGDNVGMSNTAITCADKITIGDNVNFGSGCRIYDTDFHPIAPMMRTGKMKDNSKTKIKPIAIGDYAFIGADTCILKGSTIGFGSVVGASSVVSGEIPPMQIWAGNPARFIRNLSEKELVGFEPNC